MTKPVLGYWDIRGLVQPSRLVFEYSGTQYEDRRIVMSKPDWLAHKTTLGFDFPNLPFYEDEDVKITQSLAILKHLGRKFGLDGSTVRAKAEVDMVLDEAADVRNPMVALCYRSDFSPALMKEWVEGSGEGMKSVEDRFLPLQIKLGSNDWFVNNELTVVDFMIWEMIDAYSLLFPGCLTKLTGLTSFHSRFTQLKGVKEYLESDRYKAYPIWSERAKHGFVELK
uniref:glutathione transferase n=1 Tax=Eurytemora affinis TaxID=88015 RepID=A0A8B0MCQ0_EURAF|nr:GSTmu1a [Eurytemora affinis]